jgi:hypothetical protein
MHFFRFARHQTTLGRRNPIEISKNAIRNIAISMSALQ